MNFWYPFNSICDYRRLVHNPMRQSPISGSVSSAWRHACINVHMIHVWWLLHGCCYSISQESLGIWSEHLVLKKKELSWFLKCRLNEFHIFWYLYLHIRFIFVVKGQKTLVIYLPSKNISNGSVTLFTYKSWMDYGRPTFIQTTVHIPTFILIWDKSVIKPHYPMLPSRYRSIN